MFQWLKLQTCISSHFVSSMIDEGFYSITSSSRLNHAMILPSPQALGETEESMENLHFSLLIASNQILQYWISISDYWSNLVTWCTLSAEGTEKYSSTHGIFGRLCASATVITNRAGWIVEQLSPHHWHGKVTYFYGISVSSSDWIFFLTATIPGGMLTRQVDPRNKNLSITAGSRS